MKHLLALALALSSGALLVAPALAGAIVSPVEPAGIAQPAQSGESLDTQPVRRILRTGSGAVSCDDATWPYIPANCLTRAKPTADKSN